MLAAWEGLTADETASVLGCSTAAAKVRLVRAKRRLRAAVEDLVERPSPTLVLEECHED
jgi:RNA polymerase sigma-70 factor (ECF subfamily)